MHPSRSTPPGMPGLGCHASPVVAWGYFSGQPGSAQAQGPPLPASLPSDHPGSNPRSRPSHIINDSLSWGDEDMWPHPGQRASSGLPGTEPWRDPRRIHAETLVSGLSPAGSVPGSVCLGFVHQPPGGGMGWGRAERGTGAVKGDFEWRAPHLGPSTPALPGPLLGEGRCEPPQDWLTGEPRPIPSGLRVSERAAASPAACPSPAFAEQASDEKAFFMSQSETHEAHTTGLRDTGAGAGEGADMHGQGQPPWADSSLTSSPSSPGPSWGHWVPPTGLLLERRNGAWGQEKQSSLALPWVYLSLRAQKDPSLSEQKGA